MSFDEEGSICVEATVSDEDTYWAMAYKFASTEATTRLLSVSWQVGRSGRVTPIANLEPVELAGATIKRATLNNIDDIRKKNLYETTGLLAIASCVLHVLRRKQATGNVCADSR